MLLSGFNVKDATLYYISFLKNSSLSPDWLKCEDEDCYEVKTVGKRL